MELKDLKVGDQVLYKESPVKVSEINSDKLVVQRKDNYKSIANLSDLCPLSITEGSLRGNKGIVIDNYQGNIEIAINIMLNDDYDGNYLWLYQKAGVKTWLVSLCTRAASGSWVDNVKHLHTIRYVHELQHILWALGNNDNLQIN